MGAWRDVKISEPVYESIVSEFDTQRVSHNWPCAKLSLVHDKAQSYTNIHEISYYQNK